MFRCFVQEPQNEMLYSQYWLEYVSSVFDVTIAIVTRGAVAWCMRF